MIPSALFKKREHEWSKSHVDQVNNASMSLTLIGVSLESLPVQGWFDCLTVWISSCVPLMNIGRTLHFIEVQQCAVCTVVSLHMYAFILLQML